MDKGSLSSTQQYGILKKRDDKGDAQLSCNDTSTTTEQISLIGGGKIWLKFSLAKLQLIFSPKFTFSIHSLINSVFIFCCPINRSNKLEHIIEKLNELLNKQVK
jgi:hypothetical protein